MTKELVLKDDITIINVFVPNGTSKYVTQKLIELQGEIDDYIITVGDFNTTLSEMSTFSKKKISKDMGEFNNTINQQEISDIYR